MPLLTRLSVVSSDFSYAGRGFAQFFASHGDRLRHHELGHSSSIIEERYLPTTTTTTSRLSIPLAQWCPNLVEFICSADADWNWQTPDWIAPNIFLPTYPPPPHRYPGYGSQTPIRCRRPTSNRHASFFPLVEQLSSLLRKAAFPKLQFIWDLSRESHAMRSTVPVEGIVLKFLDWVLKRCIEREVWLEDQTGVNITQRDLLRAVQCWHLLYPFQIIR